MSERGTSQEPDTRFSGYGDRVGSGVELAPARWTGGEIVTDPTFVSKSLTNVKPRRFYYSPIGDGVVAADGVEMKYGPRNTEPRVTVIQQRTVERAPPGHATVRVTEKVWSEGGGGGAGNESIRSGHGSNGFPPANNLAAAAGGTQPPYAGNGVAAHSAPQQQQQPAQQQYAAAPQQFQPQKAAPQAPASGGYAAVRPANSAPQPPPATKYSAPLGINTAVGAPAYGSSARSTPNQFGASNATSPLGGGADRSFTGTPNSMKSFKTSSSLYEPGMRYEIKRDYMVSNPRELIHQYATTTPIDSIPGAETTSTQITKQVYHSTVEETSIGPYPPYAAGAHVPNPNKFVRQLRDETMTSTQRQANQSAAAPKDAYAEQKVEEIRRQTTSTHFSPNAEIDSLTSRLVTGLHASPYDKKHY